MAGREINGVDYGRQLLILPPYFREPPNTSTRGKVEGPVRPGSGGSGVKAVKYRGSKARGPRTEE
jgi:hypothetical protein